MWTTRDIVNKYKITQNTVYVWRKEGLPYKKIGKMVRFDPEEVEKWVKENKMRY